MNNTQTKKRISFKKLLKEFSDSELEMDGYGTVYYSLPKNIEKRWSEWLLEKGIITEDTPEKVNLNGHHFIDELVLFNDGSRFNFFPCSTEREIVGFRLKNK